ncbi:hypothetical protein BD410DRAFT_841904 [Rickenella mellea]|uniref:DUF6533 domain-containing protein n=1 Tax=Rickenella mellea TaxID=50990 RepID=A0A4Y7PXF2_9AGAM|nr:hypothetical protein BD410DRAFT_841904 [Rickenella mellea]
MAVELPTDQLSNILHYISLARYSDLVALVVLVYDYLLTFDLEFSQVWCQRVSLASSLFLWIRYMHPLKIILQLKLAFASPSNLDDSVGPSDMYYYYRKSLISFAQGCLSRQIANILEVITPLVVILIFVNRTWAIYLKSRKILILFGSLGAGLAILKIVLLIVGVSYNVRWEELCAEIGPHGYSTISRMMWVDTMKAHILLTDFTCRLLHTIAFFDFTFDSAVFWSTFYKTFHIARDMRLQRNPNSITYWILRDAFMYYLTRISLITHFTPLQVAFGSHLSMAEFRTTGVIRPELESSAYTSVLRRPPTTADVGRHPPPRSGKVRPAY